MKSVGSRLLLLLLLSSSAFSQKKTTDFSGTYTAQVKFADGTKGPLTLRIVQTADTVELENLATGHPSVYRLNEVTESKDSHGVARRVIARIIGRTLRLETENPPGRLANPSTQEDLFELSKDSKKLSHRVRMSIAGTQALGDLTYEVYERISDPATATSSK